MTKQQLEQLEKQKTEDIRGARRTILEVVNKRNSPYAHNIITWTLIPLSQKWGVEAANALVDELKLERLFGIQKARGE